MKILGLIPARGGSKGVPRKNLKLLCGKPLIQYTIDAAVNSGVLDEIFVSTDDQEIADVAIKSGIEVPVLRPRNLALDNTPTLPVINHVIEYLQEQGKSFDAIFLLQPTSPFRTAKDIQEAIQIFKNNHWDSLISVLEVPLKFNPYYAFLESDTSLLNPVMNILAIRRQDLPKAYIREGSIYLFSLKTLQRFNNIYGEKIGSYVVKMPSVNIDTIEDFYEAEKLMVNLKS